MKATLQVMMHQPETFLQSLQVSKECVESEVRCCAFSQSYATGRLIRVIAAHAAPSVGSEKKIDSDYEGERDEQFLCPHFFFLSSLDFLFCKIVEIIALLLFYYNNITSCTKILD